MKKPVAIIAIIETEQISAEGLKALLATRGYQAYIFPKPPLATEEFGSFIFLNEHMGMLSGEQLHTTFPEKKVIVCTDFPIEMYHPAKGVNLVLKGKSNSFEKIIEILEGE